VIAYVVDTTFENRTAAAALLGDSRTLAAAAGCALRTAQAYRIGERVPPLWALAAMAPADTVLVEVGHGGAVLLLRAVDYQPAVEPRSPSAADVLAQIDRALEAGGGDV